MRQRIKTNMVGSSDKQRAYCCKKMQERLGTLPEKKVKKVEFVTEIHKFTIMLGQKVDCTSWDKETLAAFNVFEETIVVVKKKSGLFK